MKKFNILDWFIIAVIIFVIVFGVCRVFFFGEASISNNAKNGSSILVEDATATVTFRVKGIRDLAAEKLQVGAECFDSKSNMIGIISNVEKTNYKEYNLNDNNNYVLSEYDDKFDVHFTLDLKGTNTVSGFETAGSAVLGVGTTRYITCNGVTYEAMAVDVVVK